MPNLPRITLKHLLNSISTLIKEHKISDEAEITYIYQVTENASTAIYDTFNQKIPIGSYFIGIEFVDQNGNLCSGSIFIEPKPTDEKLQ